MKTFTTKTIGGTVASSGVSVTGSGYVSRKTGTGGYLLTFPGQRLISCAATAISFCTVQVGNITQTSDTINVATSTSNTGSSADSGFSFTATVVA